jgi:acetolactate synthase-1/2/3 large subunit
VSKHYRVADLLADLLELEAIDCVFTVPGGTVVPLLEAISKHPSIRVVVSKDEAGAAYAADGYARISGKLGVLITIGGPGATNALTALCCSKVQGNPVLLISGEVGSASMGKGAVQDGTDLGLDVLAMSRPSTALSVSVSSAAKAPFALVEAFRRALNERQPVHVSLPLDVQMADTSRACPTTPESYRGLGLTVSDPGGVARAAALLRDSRRVAFLVGNGARESGPELLALAEALDAPVATTLGAKGVFPENHPLSLGVFSFGSGALAREVLTGELDVLCAVGTKLGEFATMNFSKALRPRRALIHVDRDPGVFGRNYEVIPVLSDARTALGQLCAALEPVAARDGNWWQAARREHPRVVDEAALTSASLPIRPERVMDAIQATLPKDACLVADIGTSCLFAAHYLRLTPPQRCYVPMGWSCMAHPLAASIGVRLASSAPTLCISGDAAFLSKGLELHAAVEAGLSGLVWVVLSNGGHGLVRLGTDMLLGKGHGVESGAFRGLADAARIARAVGAEGYTVSEPSDLEPALCAALAAKVPAVVDVIVDPSAGPPMTDRIQGLRQASQVEARGGRS